MHGKVTGSFSHTEVGQFVEWVFPPSNLVVQQF